MLALLQRLMQPDLQRAAAAVLHDGANAVPGHRRAGAGRDQPLDLVVPHGAEGELLSVGCARDPRDALLEELTVVDEVDSTNALIARLPASRRHRHVVLAESLPNAHVKLTKNPAFHSADEVAIDTIYFYPTEDRSAALSEKPARPWATRRSRRCARMASWIDDVWHSGSARSTTALAGCTDR